MSYSRWSSMSVWYTFWSAVSETETTFKLPTQKLKHKQTFEICDFPSYYITYGDIKEKGLTQILREVEEFYTKGNGAQESTQHGLVLNANKNPTKAQMSELRSYLQSFVKDVDEHFSWKNFFKYEWYYPIRNKIYFLVRDKIRRYFKK